MYLFRDEFGVGLEERAGVTLDALETEMMVAEAKEGLFPELFSPASRAAGVFDPFEGPLSTGSAGLSTSGGGEDSSGSPSVPRDASYPDVDMSPFSLTVTPTGPEDSPVSWPSERLPTLEDEEQQTGFGVVSEEGSPTSEDTTGSCTPPAARSPGTHMSEAAATRAAAEAALQEAEDEEDGIAQRPRKRRRQMGGKDTRHTSVSLPRDTLLTMSLADMEAYIVRTRQSRRLTKEEEKDLKRQRRLVKNRESAMASRNRKKEDMAALHESVSSLRRENKEQKSKIGQLEAENRVLREQVESLSKRLNVRGGYALRHRGGKADTLALPEGAGRFAGVALLAILFSFGMFVNPIVFMEEGGSLEVVPDHGAGSSAGAPLKSFSQEPLGRNVRTLLEATSSGGQAAPPKPTMQAVPLAPSASPAAAAIPNDAFATCEEMGGEGRPIEVTPSIATYIRENITDLNHLAEESHVTVQIVLPRSALPAFVSYPGAGVAPTPSSSIEEIGDGDVELDCTLHPRSLAQGTPRVLTKAKSSAAL